MSLNTMIGDPASDSYVSVAEADTGAALVGDPNWTALSTGEKESALRRAVSWLDGSYNTRWPGVRKNGRLQARAWPRSAATDNEGFSIDDTTIPSEVMRAQIAAALIEAVIPGALAPMLQNDRFVTSERIDVITTTYERIREDVPGVIFPALSAVEYILAGIVIPVGVFVPSAMVV